jgi:hypothetical protein
MNDTWMATAVAIALLAGTCQSGGQDEPSIETKVGAITGCKPGFRQVALFSGKNREGRCAIFGLKDGALGAYGNLGWFGFRDDDAESLWVGDDVFVHLHEREGFRGQRWTFDANMVVNDLGWFSNRLTGLRVIWNHRDCRTPGFHPEVGQVAIWRDDLFGGDCVVLSRDDSGAESVAGRFGNLALEGLEIASASSLKIGPRTHISAFRQVNFTGVSESFGGDEGETLVPTLRGTILGNDQLRSLIVF